MTTHCHINQKCQEAVISLLQRGGRYTARQVSNIIRRITPHEAGAILRALKAEGRVVDTPVTNGQSSKEWEGVSINE